MSAIIEVGIPYSCSLKRFCVLRLWSSSLSLSEGRGELGTLVDNGTLAVNGGTKVPIFGRVIGADVETVERVVTPVSIETGIAMVAPTAVDTLKSPDRVVSCKYGACEDNYEELELARTIYLPFLKCIHKQLGVFSNQVTRK